MGMESNGNLIQEALRSVPMPPRAVRELLRISQEPDVDMQRIVDTITSDEALTARVIRMVNSALFGLQRRVTSVQQAAVLLGKEALNQVAVGVAALHLETDGTSDLPLERQAFWQHSMSTAFLARRLSERSAQVTPEEAFTAGLLHDIGKLVLMGHLGPEYGRILQEAADAKRPLHEVEREVLGVDHEDLGQGLCERWKLPPSLQEANALHAAQESESGPLQRIIQAANAVAKVAGIGESGNPFVPLEQLPVLEVQRGAPGYEATHALHDEVVRFEQAFRTEAGADGQDKPLEEVPERPRGRVRVDTGTAVLDALLITAVSALHYMPEHERGQEPSDPDVPVVAGLGQGQRPPGAEGTPVWLGVTEWHTAQAEARASTALDAQALRTWLQRELKAAALEQA